MDWEINCEISDDLDTKYKQNAYSVTLIETQGSHDLKEDDDGENELKLPQCLSDNFNICVCCINVAKKW